VPLVHTGRRRSSIAPSFGSRAQAVRSRGPAHSFRRFSEREASYLVQLLWRRLAQSAPIATKATIVVRSFRRAISSSTGLSFRSSSHACSKAESISCESREDLPHRLRVSASQSAVTAQRQLRRCSRLVSSSFSAFGSLAPKLAKFSLMSGYPASAISRPGSIVGPQRVPLKILWRRKPVHWNDRAPRWPPAYDSAIEVSARWPLYAPSRLTRCLMGECWVHT
jgi:hypothetical protein